jgi:hypothetical protein
MLANRMLTSRRHQGGVLTHRQAGRSDRFLRLLSGVILRLLPLERHGNGWSHDSKIGHGELTIKPILYCTVPP